MSSLERLLKCRFCDFTVTFKAKRATGRHFDKLNDHVFAAHPDEAERLGLDDTESGDERTMLDGITTVPAMRREIRPFNRRPRNV